MSSVRKGSDFATTTEDEGTDFEADTDSDDFASSAYYKNKLRRKSSILV